ncbi:disease resistance protein L6-like [Syzygium oleosum]|uniref:disease resistance protein L6-like n=1 Tax=Syzygium oleosum TaxID=219896 RepID=UPI0024B894C3|nr:disease resistance protein L6-like [Syzygium oleosum]
MSTNNLLGGEYQVFLSFRGPDTRRGITNCLYHALVDVGIRVFIDDEELRPGERISGNLLLAIDDSKLYMPIFSKNYASSHWCLRELAKMVENTSKSKEEGNEKVILPIFYDVKPADVKLKTSLYNDAILNLEQKMEDEKKFSHEEIKTWRQALSKVDDTKGWELQKYPGEGVLIEAVVNEVVVRLKTRQRKVTGDLVGMEDRMAAINSLLDIKSGGVRLIGIYGMDGIGKSTLAKIIYNQLCPRFGKNCSFLDGIREMAKTKGLVKLQEQLLSNISNSRVARNIDNIDHGIDTIREIICNKKVLVVLDDVNEGNQIEYLIGINPLFVGTRILVTTRDKSVLKIRGLKYEIVPYEMEVLNDKDALQLFSRHAFNADIPPYSYDTFSKDIVSTAGGLPSALQAIGSLLFLQEEKKIWEEMLEKLRKTPNSDVLGKLRITYDALEADQQQIFLDVACFFMSKDKANPVLVWKDCGFSPEYAIDVLINRCTIKVLEGNKFWMHDQFRDLGRAIANQERSRLWVVDDIIRELRSTEIKSSVQALDLTNWSGTDDQITVTAEQIKRFPRLRLLWLHNITCQGDFAGYLFELKWISLFYPDGSSERHPRFEATNLHLENVVVVNLVGHGFMDDHIRSLIQEGRKLKVLILENNKSIYRTPTFSEYSVLEKLTIFECSSLMEIDCSIGKLRWLTELSIESCRNLGKLPEQIGELPNLQHLSLRNCDSLSELPESVSKLESLMKLDVSHTPITVLQDSIGRLPSLSSLNVSSTPIAKVPSTMSELSCLETLDLEHCHKIQELPELPKSLTTLRLRSTSLQTVPNLSNLTNLVELLLSDGSESKATSNIIQTCDLQWIGRLSKLRKQQLCLLNVRTLPTELGSLSLLKELTMYGLDFQSLEQLPSNLTVLELDRTQVKQVQLDGLPQLEHLTIKRCKLVKRLSIPSSLRKLREAEVSSCTDLVEVQFLGDLISLEGLCIEDCKSLERLVNLSEEPGFNERKAPELTNGGRRVSLVSSSLKMLQVFKLSRCPELHEIQFASTFKPLGVFSVEECTSLKKIGGLSNLKNLTWLGIVGCESLQVVDGMDELERLEQLKVYRCRSMETIIDASSSKIPKECQIQMRDCGELLDTGSDGSSITWESYREKILNASRQASDSEVETTFYDCEAEIGDPLMEQQDDGDELEDNDEDDGREDEDDEDDGREDDDDENEGKDDDDDDNSVHEDNEDNYGEDDKNDDVHLSREPSLVCSVDDNDENNDVDKEGEGNGNSDSKDGEDEDEDGEDDEDNNVHEVLQSSRLPSPVCSVDDNVENNDVNEEGEGDGYGDGDDDEEERDNEVAEEEQDDGDDYNNNEYDDNKEDNGDEYGDDGEYNGEDDDGN